MDKCFNTTNTHTTVGCNLTHCDSPVSQNQLFNETCPHCVQLLAECEHVLGSRLLYRHDKTYYARMNKKFSIIFNKHGTQNKYRNGCVWAFFCSQL